MFKDILLFFYNTAIGENCRKILGLVCNSETAETLKYYAFHPYMVKKNKKTTKDKVSF